MKRIPAKDWGSVPNLMGYFRILLIPVFVWIYVTAQSSQQIYCAAAVVGLSGLTDLFDGWVARRFHQITELGKFLDPLADKLTQGALVLCLSSRYVWMLLPVGLFLLKEGMMAVMGLLLLRRGSKLDGAMWFGKVCTAVLYLVMFALLLVPMMPLWLANTLIGICAAVMLFTMLLYIPVFIRMWKQSAAPGGKDGAK